MTNNTLLIRKKTHYSSNKPRVTTIQELQLITAHAHATASAFESLNANGLVIMEKSIGTQNSHKHHRR